MKFCDYAENNDTRAVARLLKEDAKKPNGKKIPTEFRVLALWHAIDNNNLTMVKCLLDHDYLSACQFDGYDLGRALWRAGERKFHDIEKIILEYDAKIPEARKIPESDKKWAQKKPLYVPRYLGVIGPTIAGESKEPKPKRTWYSKVSRAISKIRLC